MQPRRISSSDLVIRRSAAEQSRLSSVKCSVVPPLLALDLSELAIDEEVYLEFALLAQSESPTRPLPVSQSASGLVMQNQNSSFGGQPDQRRCSTVIKVLA
jgi:hypothetical protein